MPRTAGPRINGISSTASEPHEHSLIRVPVTRREFLLGLVGAALASSLSPLQEALSKMTDTRRIDDVLGSDGKNLSVYSNEIDLILNKETLEGLPVPVERVTDPSRIDKPLLVLGGPEAREDEFMPRNLVKELYTPDEVGLLRKGRWTVKVGKVEVGGKEVRIVNIAGGDRYLTKRGVDFLLGQGNHALDYNRNGLTNLEEIGLGRNPLEKQIDAYVEKISGKGGVEVRAHVDHPLPVEVYYSLDGELYKMIYNGKDGYYYIKIPNSRIGDGLTMTVLVSDVIDDGLCLYSNSKVRRVMLRPTTTTSEEKTTTSKTESKTKTQTQTETQRQIGNMKERLNSIRCVKQICNTCCLYAAIEMATRGGVTQRQLMRDLGRPPFKDPYFTKTVEAYLEKRGYGWKYYPTRPVYRGFERIIDEGGLPIFWFSYHARTAYGYRDEGNDKGKIYYCDPISGKNSITFSRLEELKERNNLSGPIKIYKL